MVTAACEGNRMVYGYRRVREVCKANGLSLGENRFVRSCAKNTCNRR